MHLTWKGKEVFLEEVTCKQSLKGPVRNCWAKKRKESTSQTENNDDGRSINYYFMSTDCVSRTSRSFQKMQIVLHDWLRGDKDQIAQRRGCRAHKIPLT